jgi:hypothetical protein
MVTYAGKLRHHYLNPARTALLNTNEVLGVTVNMDIETGPDGAFWYIEGGGYAPGTLKRIVGAGGTPTPTPVVSPTRTATPGSPSPTRTVTSGPSATPPAPTASPTRTATAIPSATPTNPAPSATRTITPPASATATPSPAGPTATLPAATATPGPASPTVTLAATGTPTAIPATRTPGPPIPTSTTCPVQFTDVPASNPFYLFIRCLACRGIVSGYSDGAFRWGNDVTRGQLAKIIVGAAGLLTGGIPSTQQTFSDVPNTNTFWRYIEVLAQVGAISSYGCGGPGEPCDGQNRPYFRWGNPATRGQISKIVGITAGWNGPIPTTQQTFADAPPANPFWTWIEELAGRGIISGYACGGPGEPCDGQNRPYFRWGANATRGQMSKIAAQTFFPNCQTR